MNCSDLTNDLLLQYYEKSITDNQQNLQIKEHLSKCASCIQRLEDIVLIFENAEKAYKEIELKVPSHIDEKMYREFEKAPSAEETKTLYPKQRRLVGALVVVGALLVIGFIFVSKLMNPSFTRETTKYREEKYSAQPEPNKKINEKIESLTDEISFLTKSLQAKDAAIKTLEESVSNLSKTISALRSELDERKNKIESLVEDLKKANEKISSLSANVAELTEYNNKLKEQITQLEEKMFLKGDVNGDGVVNILDSSLLCDYILEKRDFKDAYKFDINNDGKIDVADALLILKSIPENRK